MISQNSPARARLTRRRFILLTGAGAGAGVVLAACGGDSGSTTRAVGPTDTSVARAEARRRRANASVRDVTLVAAATTIDLGGTSVDTRAFGNRVPGTVVRANAGDVLRVAFRNDLDVPTTIHWHGIALRNDMDGVPGITQDQVEPGDSFTYEYVAPDPGTYWFHPHVGTQLDHGLYAPLIIDDPREPGEYDDEWIVVLDDWTDGVGESPDDLLRTLTGRGSGMSGMGQGMEGMEGMGGMGNMEGMEGTGMSGGTGDMPMSAGSSDLLGGDAGDVRYPLYLANGRPPTDPETFSSAPGRRLRLRLINAGSDTAFRVAIGGHRLRITHTDGFPVDPVEGDAVLVGMGERIDAIVTLGDGVFPLVALAEGKDAQAVAVLRTGSGDHGGPAVRPGELDGRVLTVADLFARADVALDGGEPDRTLRATLGGDMMSYRWTINGRTFDDMEPLEVRSGERVRLEFENPSMMFHPMHVHGHTFGLVRTQGAGARKDTVIVLPGDRVTVDLDTDNPGQWATHCHNAYHAEAGMMTVLSYRR